MWKLLTKPMKIKIINSCLLLFFSINSFGQWYARSYNVTDIYSLSENQLNELLGESKNNLLVSGGIAGGGVILFLLGRYTDPDIDENSSFFEQLVGDEGMKKIGMVAGLGMLAGGTIASIVYLGRVIRIKSIINEYYPSIGSINFTPTIILNSNTKSCYTGFMLTFNF